MNDDAGRCLERSIVEGPDPLPRRHLSQVPPDRPGGVEAGGKMKCFTCDGKGWHIHNGITLKNGKIYVSKRWLDKKVKCSDCKGTGIER